MDERAACAQLKRRFEAAGFQIRENQTFDEGGVRFDIDGFDAARRVGYEYVTEEAGDGWDVDGEVIAALAERRKRGELHVLIVDEADAPDAASLDHAIDEFLKTLPAAGAQAAAASPAAEQPAATPPAPEQAEQAPPAPEQPTASEQAAAATPLDEPEEIAAPEPDEPDEPPAPLPTPAGKTTKPPPTPKAAKTTKPPPTPTPTPRAAKKKPARKPK